MQLPPLWHCLLYKRTPVTSMARSFSCCSLSLLLSEMKVIISVWGNTLCKAAVSITKREKTLSMREQKRKSSYKQKQPLLNKCKKVGNLWDIYTSRQSSDSLDSKDSSQFTMFISKYQWRKNEILFSQEEKLNFTAGSLLTCYLPDSLNICWGSQARSQQHIGNNLLIHILHFFLHMWTTLSDGSN